MKSVTDETKTEYRLGKVNDRFYQFGTDCGFEVKTCIAGRPQTKANVEDPMKLLDKIHAYQGKFVFEELHLFIQELYYRANSLHL